MSLGPARASMPSKPRRKQAVDEAAVAAGADRLRTMSGLSRTWPLPALACWTLAWGLYWMLSNLAAPLPIAVAAAVALGVAASVIGSTPWRRILIVGGFPLSLLASGVAGALPAWGWLLPLVLLALVYPLNAWRDAPLFPTPVGALTALAQAAPLGPGARVLDAGCGVGDGLRELRRAYPEAMLDGVEWSWPLRLLCGWRCRYARIRRGDMWAVDWSGYDLVYVFQRPESMARAYEKAMRELPEGGWLASLEFEVSGVAATRVVECEDGRRVWLYRVSAGPRPKERISAVPAGSQAHAATRSLGGK